MGFRVEGLGFQGIWFKLYDFRYRLIIKKGKVCLGPFRAHDRADQAARRRPPTRGVQRQQRRKSPEKASAPAPESRVRGPGWESIHNVGFTGDS